MLTLKINLVKIHDDSSKHEVRRYVLPKVHVNQYPSVKKMWKGFHLPFINKLQFFILRKGKLKTSCTSSFVFDGVLSVQVRTSFWNPSHKLSRKEHNMPTFTWQSWMLDFGLCQQGILSSLSLALH